MPFKTVSGTRKRVKSLKSLSDKQIRTFIKVFNKLEKEGTKESSAIAQSVAAAKKVDKNMSKEIEVSKATVNDKRRMLSREIKSGFLDDFDLDTNEVFIGKFDHDTDTFKLFKHSFTMTDTKVEIEEEGVEVIEQTVHLEVEKSLDAPVTESKLLKILDKFFGSSKESKIDVIKQFGSEDESMFAIEPLYIAPGEIDGHAHTMDLEGITGMVESLNKANDEDRLQSGLFHKHKTNAWSLEKAWVNPVECMIGDQLVPEGQPIAKTVFTNKTAFQMRIDGDISGLSIGARAKEIAEIEKDLSLIQGKTEPTHILKGVHFDWDHPELTYTSPSQGGAASLKNEAYEINKAKKAKLEDLDNEQVSILKEIGEEFISLEKHLGTDKNQTPSSSAEARAGEETQVTKGSNDMSENMVTREEFVELQKALAVEKAVNSLTGFAFEAELNKAVAGAIANLEDADKEAVTKAFDALVARGEEALEKAKEAAPKQEESDLSKALSEEAGEGGEADEPVEKTLAERALDAQAKIKGDK